MAAGMPVSYTHLDVYKRQGLYFAGEVIDIDGYTGGYNLQAAFSTGYAAGTAAAYQLSLIHI